MKECSLWSQCYGHTPVVYTEMAARSRSGEAVGVEGGRSRTRADPDQMEVRGGHGWRDGERDEGTGLCWRPL